MSRRKCGLANAGLSADASRLDIEDTAALVAYLASRSLLPARETPVVHALAGGVSSRTVLVEITSGSVVVKQSLERLRVATDWRSDPRRIHREAAALRLLERLVPGHVPAFVFEDFDQHLLVMAAVPLPHDVWKDKLLLGDIDVRDACDFGRLLGAIHIGAAGEMPLLQAQLADRTYFETLRLEPYFGYTAARVPEAAAILSGLIAETREIQLTFVHGDASPKNVIVGGDRIILLDHEVAHLGDPAFDAGFVLSHLLSKANHLPVSRRALIEAIRGLWGTYRNAIDPAPWSGAVEYRATRHAAACLLARVCGRSPLEYLTPDERARQRVAATTLLMEPPVTVTDLSDRFCDLVSA